MAKRVTKTTLARVKERKKAAKVKSLIEPENKLIAKGDPRAWDYEKDIGRAEKKSLPPLPPEPEDVDWPPEVPEPWSDQWPQNGKPNWPFIAIGVATLALIAIIGYINWGLPTF